MKGRVVRCGCVVGVRARCVGAGGVGGCMVFVTCAVDDVWVWDARGS